MQKRKQKCLLKMKISEQTRRKNDDLEKNKDSQESNEDCRSDGGGCGMPVLRMHVCRGALDP